MATSYTPTPQFVILLRCRDVVNLVGLSRSTLYVLVKDGTFPSPIQVGPRAVRWLASEVNAWIDSRILITRPPVISASGVAPDVVHTHPASKCPSQIVKANQGLTTLTEVWSRSAPTPASIHLTQARDETRLSGQGAC